jgi:alpha-amylase
MRWALSLVLAALLAGACEGMVATPGPTGSAATEAPATIAPPTCPPVPAPNADARWWEDRVFYEIFVRSFADSDGDGIGDLRGLIDRLDHLNDGDAATTDDLGVTGIWLMPIAEATSYHGYDVIDYRTVDPDYGTLADLRELLAAARARDIRVVVDLVINHTSVDHPWFRASRDGGSPYDDWYIWSDVDPGYPGPDGQPVWHRAGDRWYYGLFWSGMPDLNLRDSAVTKELESIAAFWLEEVGVDGFRLDAAKHLIEDGPAQSDTPETRAWLAGFRAAVREVRPDALVLGEVWDTRLVTSAYVAEGALDLVFDFDLAGTIRGAVRLGDAGSLMAGLSDLVERYPDGGVAPFLSNHDQNRIMSQLSGNGALARSAAAILLTVPGTPFLYYGEEIGMTGTKPDERIRTPYPWTGTPPGHGFTDGVPWQPFGEGPETVNVAAQADDPGSLLSAYRRLIHLRNGHPALATGELVPVPGSDPTVAAWLRRSADETLLVVHALSDERVEDPSFDLPAGSVCGVGRAELLFASDATFPVGTAIPTPLADADGGASGYRPLVDLPGHTSWVIRLSP